MLLLVLRHRSIISLTPESNQPSSRNILAHLGRKSLKWHHPLSKCWPSYSGTCWVYFCWTSCNMDVQLTPVGTASRWKACKRPSGEDILVLAMLWFSSVMVLYYMCNSRIWTCCSWESLDTPHVVFIWHPAIFIGFLSWRRMSQDIVLPALKTSNMLPSCGWWNRYIQSICLGWINLPHTRCDVHKLWKGLCWIVAYQWHLHCIIKEIRNEDIEVCPWYLVMMMMYTVKVNLFSKYKD